MTSLAHPTVVHTILVLARALAILVCTTSILYYAFAIYCARDFFRRSPRFRTEFEPPISILKPLHGLDPEAYDNFASFCRQRYPRFQLLFGAESAEDPAIPIARRVAEDHPDVDIAIVVGKATASANRKVGCLASMLPEAKHPYILVSDSDIRVSTDFLKVLVEPMAEPGVGVVTCLYRSASRGVVGMLSALGLSTDFQPSVLVARKIEGVSFGMGSGILIRRSILSTLGGFEALENSLADDYQLGNLPARAGHGVELARCVVDHRLGVRRLREVIDHQLRWNRGTRAARPGGYTGLLLTQGVPAALTLLALDSAGLFSAIAFSLTVGMRLTMAWYVAVRGLGDRAAGRRLWLVPLRDLFGLAMWIGGFFGSSIVWRGTRYRLLRGGLLAGDRTAEGAAHSIGTSRAVSRASASAP